MMPTPKQIPVSWKQTSTPTPSEGGGEQGESNDSILSTYDCSKNYVVVAIYTKADLPQLCTFLSAHGKGDPVSIRVIYRNIIQNGAKKTVETDAWLCVIHKDTYNALIKSDHNRRQYDFSISLYEIRPANLPSDKAFYKIYAPYPKDYADDELSRKWINTQMSNKLKIMSKIFDLDESQIFQVNPYIKSTGKYHRHMNVTITGIPKETYALIKLLIDMTHWYNLPKKGVPWDVSLKGKSQTEINDILMNTPKHFTRVAWYNSIEPKYKKKSNSKKNTAAASKKSFVSKKKYIKKVKTPSKVKTPVAGSPVISPRPKPTIVKKDKLPTPVVKDDGPVKSIRTLAPIKKVETPPKLTFGTFGTDKETVSTPAPVDVVTQVTTPTRRPNESFSLTPSVNPK